MADLMRSIRSSSSDSDSSERVQNVRAVFIKYYPDGVQKNFDESFYYKRKLGDLIFDANFEGGNLGFVERVDQYNYDLMVRPDLTNPRHRLWFNFTVSNQLPNQCVIFNFVNLSDYLKLFHDGLTPVARSRMKPNWVRLHEDQVFYYRSPCHGYRYVYSISFRFSVHDNEHQFALFYPYTYTTMSQFLDRWSLEAKRLNLARVRHEQHYQQQHKHGVNNKKSTLIKMPTSASKGLLDMRSSSRMSPDYYRTYTPVNDNQSEYGRRKPTGDSIRCHSSMGRFSTTKFSPGAPRTQPTSPVPASPRSLSSSSRSISPNLNNFKKNHKRVGDVICSSTDDIIHESAAIPIIDVRPIASTVLNKFLYHVSIGDQSSTSIINHDDQSEHPADVEPMKLSSLKHSAVSKANVVVLCRAAGNLDSASSFVCQGLIDYVMSDSLIARMVRRYINFDIFPMLDPDSVCVGNSRTDLFGQLGYKSQRVVRRNANLYAGLLSVHDYITKLIQSKIDKHHHAKSKSNQEKIDCKTTTPLDVNDGTIILIDMHVNLGLIGSRVIGSYYNEPLRMETHLSFPRLLSQFSPDFYLENCEFPPTIESIPSGLFEFKERHLVDQYRFEISPFASFKRSLTERSYEEFTPEKYLALSKAIVFTLLELAKLKQNASHTNLDELLRAFHQGPSDIDDLKLNSGEFE